MPRSFKKDKFLKDYYKCIHYQKLIKKDSAPYIKIRLLNSKGVFDAYLWDMIDFYKDRIKEGYIYAIKAKQEIYNNKITLNIKHINLVNGGKYDKYNYDIKKTELSNQELTKYYYNELIDLISIHSDSTINAISDFYIKNKKDLLNLDLLKHKTICIKHLNMIYDDYNYEISFNLYLTIILIDRIQIDTLIPQIKKLNKEYYEVVSLYVLNHKEFIKKYKYIVDLISYNLSNEKFFKTN